MSAAAISPVKGRDVRYWPERSAAGDAQALAAGRKRAKAKRECPHCLGLYSDYGYARHVKVCVSTQERLPGKHIGMDACECGRLKTNSAPCCYHCQDRLPWNEELDRLIAEGKGDVATVKLESLLAEEMRASMRSRDVG